ncbi:ABC transporter ATP-binding protein [Eubacterium aggregans]|uniref:ABC transporter ATP-binding protein n=1 Tax=Eubacterium aggregans TaxID=81409 RepID=UPI003F3A23C3
MSEKAIKVDNISKVYHLYEKPKDRLKETFSLSRKKYHDDFYALNNISFEVQECECFGIVGKNGSGKSTLLKIITGVLTPTSGSVTMNGRVAALLELGAGFNQEYTGIENIYLNGDIMGYTKSEIEERVPDILEFADIGDHIYQPVKTYSSGMFVRLAFAIAINVDPEILIVDEALSVGDAFFQLKCYKKFNEFKKSGKTILFVTHDLGSVIKYCDRALVLNEGNAIAEGGSREMVDLYKQLLVEQEMLKNNALEDDVKQHNAESNLMSNVHLSDSIIEYGTKEAEIIEISLKDSEEKPIQQIEKFETVDISFKVRFNEEIHNPIFALTFKDIKGTELTGTNNLYEEVDGFIARPGEVYEASFKQKILFQGGSYFISLGCTGLDVAGNFCVFHRLYDIVELNVMSVKDTVGYFDTETQLTINKMN